MKRLGLDLDGVLYPWQMAVYNELVIYENLAQDYHTFWSKGHKTYRNSLYWDNLVQLQHLYSNQIPGKALLELIDYLAHKYSLYYITNRPHSAFGTTINWLERYKFPYTRNLIFTKDKATACNSVGVFYMVEDRVENICDVVEAGINAIAIRQPYNEYAEKDLAELGVLMLDNVLQLKEVL